MNQTDHLYRWLITVAVVFAITNIGMSWAFATPGKPGSTCARLMAKYKTPPAYLKQRCKEKA
jgi:hypothetical protein